MYSLFYSLLYCNNHGRSNHTMTTNWIMTKRIQFNIVVQHKFHPRNLCISLGKQDCAKAERKMAAPWNSYFLCDKAHLGHKMLNIFKWKNT